MKGQLLLAGFVLGMGIIYLLIHIVDFFHKIEAADKPQATASALDDAWHKEHEAWLRTLPNAPEEPCNQEDWIEWRKQWQDTQ